MKVMLKASTLPVQQAYYSNSLSPRNFVAPAMCISYTENFRSYLPHHPT